MANSPAAEERRLIFVNLMNGVPVHEVMRSFRRSEAEVMAEFSAVIKKVRSYRFERGMPLVACETIAQARQNRVAILDTVSLLNLEAEPKFKRIESHAYNPGDGGGMSDGELAMLDFKAGMAG